MKRELHIIVFLCLGMLGYGQDWKDIQVPSIAGEGKVWELQEEVSDDFNYVFEASDTKTNFGDGKWYNFYHNGWDGPGTTYWKYNHITVDSSDLIIRASRWYKTGESAPISPWPDKMDMPEAGINAACITSNNKVLYPVFVEASISVANIALASDVWLLSPDDTQEIDIIECYGGAGSNNSYFAKYIHISHHSFVREPFQDYQPKDQNSWWSKSGITAWGDYCWNNGSRRYVRVGVNWISPKHFEYYVDGDLVRVLYDKAFATKKGSTWYYNYPTMTGGVLDFSGGYQYVVQYSTGSTYSFETLEAASNTSSVSVIDPYDYQSGAGFTKELDIIINVESQNWHVDAGRTPSDADLSDPAKNKMLVDWIRVYKPVDEAEIPASPEEPEEQTSIVSDIASVQTTLYPIPAGDYLTIRSNETYSEAIIYGLTGNMLGSSVISNNKIDVRALPYGIYLIELKNPERSDMFKVVIE